jgi:uncharacterized protein
MNTATGEKRVHAIVAILNKLVEQRKITNDKIAAHLDKWGARLVMRLFLAVICGTASGLSLGITGIGSVLAVPLFVYILGLAPHPAVCASMIAVGTTALYGCITRWRTAQIDLKSGLVVATAGILAAPFGAWMSNYIPAKPLLLLFGFVVAVVAVRLLIKGSAPRHNAGSGKEMSAGSRSDLP